MKKILLICNLLIVVLIFSSCAKKESTNVAVSDLMDRIKKEAAMKEPKEEDMKELKTAENYGISLDDVDEGKVLYSEDPKDADRIIVIKAKDESALQNIERAMTSQVISLSNTWGSNDKKEFEKVENHIVKSRGNYCIMIVSEKADEVKKIFDELT